MNPSDADRADVRELEVAYAAKVQQELTDADRMAPGADSSSSSGDVFADAFLVKGDPGPAEVAGGTALSGPDGEAARRALEALGFDPASVFATVARPEPDVDPEGLHARLRMQVEAVDPYAVVGLDRVATDLIREAFALSALRPGRQKHVHGRVFVAVDGLEASLSDVALKQRVWRQFRVLTPRPPSL